MIYYKKIVQYYTKYPQKGMNRMKILESAENYLETILILQKRNGSVRSIDIVNELDYTKPSVSIAMKHLRENGYIIQNIDATLIAQKPKIAPYIGDMRQALAHALNIDIQQINVKATTEEHLGFTGDGSGMACHAVCLIEKAER